VAAGRCNHKQQRHMRLDQLRSMINYRILDMKPDVLLYTMSWCPYCQRAKQLLREKGVQWREIDIEADPVHRRTMMDASGRKTVPQIFINGTHVGGSSDLFELDAKGDIDKLLARESPAN